MSTITADAMFLPLEMQIERRWNATSPPARGIGGLAPVHPANEPKDVAGATRYLLFTAGLDLPNSAVGSLLRAERIANGRTPV